MINLYSRVKEYHQDEGAAVGRPLTSDKRAWGKRPWLRDTRWGGSAQKLTSDIASSAPLFMCIFLQETSLMLVGGPFCARVESLLLLETWDLKEISFWVNFRKSIRAFLFSSQLLNMNKNNGWKCWNNIYNSKNNIVTIKYWKWRRILTVNHFLCNVWWIWSGKLNDSINLPGIDTSQTILIKLTDDITIQIK